MVNINAGLLFLPGMTWHFNHRIERFCVVGISYRKADAAIRSRFSLNEPAKEILFVKAKAVGVTSLVILNTCNRIELYAYISSVQLLEKWLLEQGWDLGGEGLGNYGYCLTGKEALRHAFKVGAGLDSQILGDCEIVGQLKEALKFSEKYNMVGPVMNRTFNTILQASKKVKNQTALSKGTASVSYAMVSWLSQQVDTTGLKILVIGAGPFGKTVLKNILSYCPQAKVSLTNRTAEKAMVLSKTFNIPSIAFDKLNVVVNAFDVIICCTAASKPVLRKNMLCPGQKRWVIDLSIPANVAPDVSELEDTLVANLDQISAGVQVSLEQRHLEIPKANQIVEEYLNLFLDWLSHYDHARAVAIFKRNLISLGHQNSLAAIRDSTANFTDGPGYEKAIHQRAGYLMNRMKQRREKGCEVILAYDRFINGQIAVTVHD